MNAFNKIIGYEPVKKELYRIIDMIKNKELYKNIGANIPKGILIYGNPGLGKTMLATAFIEELNIKTYYIKANMSGGKLIKEINKTFEDASRCEEAVIYFDDLDKLDNSASDSSKPSSIYRTIQIGIDSVKNKNIIVLATANDIDMLPRHLIRSGRFDYKIWITYPNDEDAQKIIEYYLRSKIVSEKLNFEDVGKMIKYSSCAKLQSIINKSAIYATYQRKKEIDIFDIFNAFYEDSTGDENEGIDSKDQEAIITSLHEAGHVVVSEILKPSSIGITYLHKSNAGYAGKTQSCKEIYRRPENILIGLGGKAAVELHYGGKVASGCQSDLLQVYRMLQEGVYENATCGISSIYYAKRLGIDVSENLKAKNELIVTSEIERYFSIAKEILLKNKEFLKKVSEELVKKQVLFYSDIQRIRNSVTITQYSI